jgi:hypothetical protein
MGIADGPIWVVETDEHGCPRRVPDWSRSLCGPPGPYADSGVGVCCPIEEPIDVCGPVIPGVPGGGWAPSLAECSYTVSGYDGQPLVQQNERGCPKWVYDLEAVPCGTVPGPDAGR